MAFQVKIHQIRAFVEVARQGSIRGASPNVEYVATGTE
ncbi:putative DNA-binding transcriptional regulator of abgABT operon [Escherichia coli]|nr:putative DNA-binding transcriptional regulator of abgABT operon [Escherichia coli]